MPFSSLEFRAFAASYEFEVITTSPGDDQNNGKAENTKTAKSNMKKAKHAGRDIYFSLIDFSKTSSEGMSISPAQRMFGRRTTCLKPRVKKDVKVKLLKQKSKQAKYYNQNTKELLPVVDNVGN